MPRKCNFWGIKAQFSRVSLRKFEIKLPIWRVKKLNAEISSNGLLWVKPVEEQVWSHPQDKKFFFFWFFFITSLLPLGKGGNSCREVRCVHGYLRMAYFAQERAKLLPLRGLTAKTFRRYSWNLTAREALKRKIRVQFPVRVFYDPP
jgi:hypothetical protein